MDYILPEEQLIEYAKPYLKANGFKKKNKRWTKDIGEFTLCFYIQGSFYAKENYYIRPGVCKMEFVTLIAISKIRYSTCRRNARKIPH